jgi:hypothetical protein
MDRFFAAERFRKTPAAFQPNSEGRFAAGYHADRGTAAKKIDRLTVAEKVGRLTAAKKNVTSAETYG